MTASFLETIPLNLKPNQIVYSEIVTKLYSKRVRGIRRRSKPSSKTSKQVFLKRYNDEK